LVYIQPVSNDDSDSDLPVAGCHDEHDLDDLAVVENMPPGYGADERAAELEAGTS
jgi:hypothetical protein